MVRAARVAAWRRLARAGLNRDTRSTTGSRRSRPHEPRRRSHSWLGVKMTCPHCGSPHPAGSAFCPMTGRPIGSTAMAAPSPRGAGAVLGDALQLYRGHAKAFLAAAAVALLPVYVVHAGLAAALLPSRAYTADVDARAARMQRRSEELQRRMQSGTLTSAEAARAQQEMMQDLGAAMGEAGGALAATGIFL